MKSTITSEIQLAAIDQGYTVCAYSGELTKENFQDWLMHQACDRELMDVKFDERSGRNYTYVPYRVQDQIRKWLLNKFYLFDNSNAAEADETEEHAVLRIFTMCARRYGCKLFLVDNLMSAINEAENEFLAQTRFVKALSKFAKQYKAHVLLVCHPRKAKQGERFTNDSVSGSSNITNLADTVINVERPNIRITKNRAFGETGLIICGYDPATRRIFQADTGDTYHYGWDRSGLEDLVTNKVAEYPIFNIQLGKEDTDDMPYPF